MMCPVEERVEWIMNLMRPCGQVVRELNRTHALVIGIGICKSGVYRMQE